MDFSDRLIREVKARKSLWDKTCNEYKDNNLKETQWREIAQVLYKDFDKKNKKAKERIVSDIQKKWENLRESYMRHYRCKRASKKFSKPYIYAQKMNFLNEEASEGSSHSENERGESSSQIENESEGSAPLIENERDDATSRIGNGTDHSASRIEGANNDSDIEEVEPTPVPSSSVTIKDEPLAAIEETLARAASFLNYIKEEPQSSLFSITNNHNDFPTDLASQGRAQSPIFTIRDLRPSVPSSPIFTIRDLRPTVPSPSTARTLPFSHSQPPISTSPNLPSSPLLSSRTFRPLIEPDLSFHHRNKRLRPNETNCDDMDFFRSLMPLVKSLPLHQKMKFRMDVMKKATHYADYVDNSRMHIAPTYPPFPLEFEEMPELQGWRTIPFSFNRQNNSSLSESFTNRNQTGDAQNFECSRTGTTGEPSHDSINVL